jgi:uncharacterized protein involved in oxidation of intracellular sulfur
MAARRFARRDRRGVVKVLVILQGRAYGDERAYNGLRLAGNLAKRDDVQVRVFCFGDAVGCAVAGQQLPNGYCCSRAAGAGRCTGSWMSCYRADLRSRPARV